jgi:hypothetical protein
MYIFTPNDPVLKDLNARSLHVTDQILHTNELTIICRALATASSPSLDLVFCSNQLHAGTIDTLPERGIKIHTHTPQTNARY